MLVGALYWPRANSWGAVSAIVLGAVGLGVREEIGGRVVKRKAHELLGQETDKPEVCRLARASVCPIVQFAENDRA